MNKPECRIHTNGTKEWYLNGKLHREDINPETGLTCPAVEYANGNKEWYLNGKLHREDGPAVEYANKYWYLNDKLHREDGPAVEYANGDKYWCLNDKLHREDGPAIEFADGETQYWINGNYIPQLDNKRIYGKDNLTKYLILL